MKYFKYKGEFMHAGLYEKDNQQMKYGEPIMVGIENDTGYLISLFSNRRFKSGLSIESMRSTFTTPCDSNGNDI